MWLASKKSFGPLGTELQPPSSFSLLTLLFPFSFTCLFEIVSAGSNSLFPELSEQKELSDQLSMSESMKMESANQSQADNQDNLNSACKENYTYFIIFYVFPYHYFFLLLYINLCLNLYFDKISLGSLKHLNRD